MEKISHVKNEYRRQQWAELIHRRQESGMTVVGFCEAHSLKPKTYYYWLRKLREEECGQAVVAMPMQAEHEEICDTAKVRVRSGDLLLKSRMGRQRKRSKR